MSDHIPTTEMVVHAYRLWCGQHMQPGEFDRWLDSVKTEAWYEGFDQGVQYGMGRLANKNPYRSEQ